MKRSVLNGSFFVLVATLFLFYTKVASAQALITVSPNGVVSKNVLGESDTADEPLANRVVGTVINKIANIVISKVDAQVQVALNGEEGQENNVFKVDDEPILEIQKEVESDKILIKKLDSGFGILENGVTAITSFDVVIDPKLKNVTLNTSSGKRVLNILPSSALETLVRANIITSIKNASGINVSETENGELIYTIKGTRNINLFNIAKIDVPIVATVSATNGKVEDINEPKLLKIFGFLFS